MCNFSGLIYHALTLGILLFLSGLSIFFLGPHKNKKRDRIIGILTIAMSLCFVAHTLYGVFFHNVHTYTGNFCYTDHNVRLSFFIDEYFFWNGEGNKKGFLIDPFNKKKIFPKDFEEGKMYKVYYDKGTKIIVKIEMLE